MSIPGHLTIPIDDLKFQMLLSDWRWLVSEKLSPVLMTAFGDLFLRDESDRIHFLDLMAGELRQVAISTGEFERICEDREQRRKWFLGFLAIELKRGHGPLSLSKCWSCKVPLTLGGQIEASNFEPIDLAVYYSVLGQLHQQTKNLPAGTKIHNVKIESSGTQTKPKSFWQRITGR